MPRIAAGAGQEAWRGRDAAIFIRTLQLGPMENFVYLVGPEKGREVVAASLTQDLPVRLD